MRNYGHTACLLTLALCSSGIALVSPPFALLMVGGFLAMAGLAFLAERIVYTDSHREENGNG
jgi:hypothetical protein